MKEEPLKPYLLLREYLKGNYEVIAGDLNSYSPNTNYMSIMEDVFNKYGVPFNKTTDLSDRKFIDWDELPNHFAYPRDIEFNERLPLNLGLSALTQTEFVIVFTDFQREAEIIKLATPLFIKHAELFEFRARIMPVVSNVKGIFFEFTMEPIRYLRSTFPIEPEDIKNNSIK